MFYLCAEGGERFTLEAVSIEEAAEGAAVYGGRVIRALTPEEVDANGTTRATK